MWTGWSLSTTTLKRVAVQYFWWRCSSIWRGSRTSPRKPAAIPPTRPLGHPGGRSDHDHPPVAALTEWGPPLRGGRLPPGGQSIKLMPSRPNSVSYCGKRIPTHARQINPVIYQLCCFVEDFLKLFVLISTPFLCHNRGKRVARMIWFHQGGCPLRRVRYGWMDLQRSKEVPIDTKWPQIVTQSESGIICNQTSVT